MCSRATRWRFALGVLSLCLICRSSWAGAGPPPTPEDAGKHALLGQSLESLGAVPNDTIGKEPPLTQQPAGATRGPAVETKCPPVNTRCPPIDTKCPRAETQCPPKNTQCPQPDTKW